MTNTPTPLTDSAQGALSSAFASAIANEGTEAMTNRVWHKYDFKVGNKIVHSGISKDLDRRESEHQQRWPSGHIVKVGNATTEDAAREWEETKKKTITPRR